MDYQTFAEVLRDEGMTDESGILALWQSREERDLDEERLRIAARHTKETLPEYFATQADIDRWLDEGCPNSSPEA